MGFKARLPDLSISPPQHLPIYPSSAQKSNMKYQKAKDVRAQEIGVEGIFLQCAVLHLQQHRGGGAAGISFLKDEILFIMPLLHNKGV